MFCRSVANGLRLAAERKYLLLGGFEGAIEDCLGESKRHRRALTEFAGPGDGVSDKAIGTGRTIRKTNRNGFFCIDRTA
jgi:hypothetical protein